VFYILTKKLLDAEVSGGEIRPCYRDPEMNVDKAARVIGEFQKGRSRKEIFEGVKSMETHSDFRFLRGLHALIERRCSFEVEADKPPRDIRESLYKKGFVTSHGEREKVIREVATELDLDPWDVESWFWGDLKENEVLITDVGRDPKKLIKQYNLSATQTLLFDALEVNFNVSGNYQQIFGMLKYLGLMYTVDSNLNITVTGPGSLFKKTRKYGNQLARLLPYIMRADDWSVSAKIERDNGEPRVYELLLDDSEESLFPYMKASDKQEFDSEVERDLAARLNNLKSGWEIKREPTIIKSGNSVMIPDFSFERYGKSFYLEVVGFWTPDYLEKKIRKVRDMEADKPVVLAVNKNLKCTKEDFDSAEAVFFYDKRIPLKEIVDRMECLEQKAIEEQANTVSVDDITDKNEIVSLKDKAQEKSVPIEILKEKLRSEEGAVSEDKYLPTEKLQEIKKEIDKLEERKLPQVKKILDRYGLTESSLEKFGYTARWGSFNPNDIDVVPKTKE